MALLYPQWIWGFEVFDSGSSQNNYIDLKRASTAWAASTVYSVGNVIVPTGASANGNQFWKCTVGGTSGSSQPSWPASPTPGVTTVSDGTVTWTFVVPTVAAGVYTPDELAKNIASALNAVDAANSYSCTFSYSTLKFTIAGSATFELRWLNGPNTAKNASALLGFNNGADETGASSYLSDSAVGGQYSGAFAWTAAEPLAFTTPITVVPEWKASKAYSVGDTIVPSGASSNLAQVWKCTTAGTSHTAEPSWPANPIPNVKTVTETGGVVWTFQNPGTPASLAQRAIGTIQHISDGATMESVYFASLKYVRVGFSGLLASEQASMEYFLNWIVQGKRFTWQPDKTSTAYLKLCLANPGIVADFYQWLTRPEVGYGTLTFYEALQ